MRKVILLGITLLALLLALPAIALAASGHALPGFSLGGGTVQDTPAEDEAETNPWVGVTLVPLSERLAERLGFDEDADGLVIMRVKSESPRRKRASRRATSWSASAASPWKSPGTPKSSSRRPLRATPSPSPCSAQTPTSPGHRRRRWRPSRAGRRPSPAVAPPLPGRRPPAQPPERPAQPPRRRRQFRLHQPRRRRRQRRTGCGHAHRLSQRRQHGPLPDPDRRLTHPPPGKKLQGRGPGGTARRSWSSCGTALSRPCSSSLPAATLRAATGVDATTGPPPPPKRPATAPGRIPNPQVQTRGGFQGGAPLRAGPRGTERGPIPSSA